jgi:hypothetical protein
MMIQTSRRNSPTLWAGSGQRSGDLGRDCRMIVLATVCVPEHVHGFYCHFGFEDLPFDPERGMIMPIRDLHASGF